MVLRADGLDIGWVFMARTLEHGPDWCSKVVRTCVRYGGCGRADETDRVDKVVVSELFIEVK